MIVSQHPKVRSTWWTSLPACREVLALCVAPVQVRTRHALLITNIRVTRGMSEQHPNTKTLVNIKVHKINFACFYMAVNPEKNRTISREGLSSMGQVAHVILERLKRKPQAMQTELCLGLLSAFNNFVFLVSARRPRTANTAYVVPVLCLIFECTPRMKVHTMS